MCLAVTEDIIEIIKAFQGNNIKLDIKAIDANNIPRGNLESARLLSVSSRVNKVENDFYTLSKENIELKKDIANLKANNDELTGKVITLETSLKFITDKLAIAMPSPMVPGPDPHPHPQTLPPLPSGSDGVPSAPELPNTGDYPPSAPPLTQPDSGNEGQQVIGYQALTSPVVPNDDNSEEPNTYFSFPSSNGAAAKNSVDEGTFTQVKSKSKNKKLNSFEKHHQSIASTSSGIRNALKAYKNGCSEVMATDIGLTAASETGKSYSAMVKENRTSNNAPKTGNNGYKPKIGQAPRSATMHPHRGSSNKNNIQVNHHPNNKRRPYTAQYRKGKATDSGITIASKRPDYLNNKCLVISRVDKDITIPLLQEYINERAGRHIRFLHKPQNLAKNYATWRTIAIELNNTDYELLSKPDFWDIDIRFADYIGRRFWRNNASKMSPNERKSSMRQQWET